MGELIFGKQLIVNDNSRLQTVDFITKYLFNFFN